MIKFFERLKNRFELKYWNPGDTVILHDLDFPLLYRASLSNNGGQPIGKLLSFSKNEACILLLNNEQWYVNLENLNNITAQARKRKVRINKYMNKEFNVNSEIVHSIDDEEAAVTLDLNKLNNFELDGMMNVFVNLENYEIAETIKKILIFRNQQVIEKE